MSEEAKTETTPAEPATKKPNRVKEANIKDLTSARRLVHHVAAKSLDASECLMLTTAIEQIDGVLARLE
jgi:hypothetical protein